MKRYREAGLLSVIAGIALIFAAQISFAEDKVDTRGSKCSKCHEDEVASFQTGHHGKVWGSIKDYAEKSCESCHGTTENHLKEGGSVETIVSFGKKSVQSAAERNKQCLSCHSKTNQLAFWSVSKHSKNDVSCTSCHSMHKGKEAVKPTVQTCLTCHKDVNNMLNKQSHHPIIEGKVSCWDCHNTHGTLSHGMIKAENINQLCYKCHADKRGPYMWEHPPVEENCSTCHQPHGSSHAKLLTEKAPNLCQNCHVWTQHPSTPRQGNAGFEGAIPPAVTPAAQLIARGCVNCHSKIHGSNAPHNPQLSGGANATYNSGKYFLK